MKDEMFELKIDWKNTYKVQESNTLTAVLEAHEAVFRNELGTLNCMTAKLQVDPPYFINQDQYHFLYNTK